jgi:NitT/TauT family transport system permease protein
MDALMNSRYARLAAPLLLGVVMLVAWQALVRALDVPVYLVPAPSDIIETLRTDWALLTSSLVITLKITFFAFLLAVVLGVAAAFLFVQSRLMAG